MTEVSSRRDRPRLRVVVLPVLALALLAAGCGSVGLTEGTGDKAKGRELFIGKCGSCHTLADAGTTGQIGPNLDNAFAESRRNGLGESTFVQVVRGQIEYPIAKTSTGAPGMPKNLATGQDADDIASYVGAVAGTGAVAPPAAPPPAPKPTPAPPGAPGDAVAGKAVFASAGCGSCHTLADANASGAVGPNLDDAKPSADLVTTRVTNGQGAMPSFKGQLTETQIADVAAYVSSAAGK